jgi:hypothetical protein
MQQPRREEMQSDATDLGNEELVVGPPTARLYM